MSNEALNKIDLLISTFDTDFQTAQEQKQRCYTQKRQRLLKELLVYGYVRRETEKDQLPTELYHLCFLFYYQSILKDEWNASKLYTQCTELDQNENWIKRLGTAAGDYQYQEGFGTLHIKKGDIQQWRINVKKSETHYIHIGFGIWTVDKVQLSPRPLRDRESFLWNGIFLNAMGPTLSNRGTQEYKVYGRKWTQDDVVTMTLDMTGDKYGTLSYKINEEDLGVGWDKLDISETYCLAVWIGNPNTVQLMNDDYDDVIIYQ